MENVVHQQGKIKVEGATLTGTEDRGAMAKAAVKLPKIEIKSFSGDYTCWKSFKETFEATVQRRTDLKNRKIYIFAIIIRKDSFTSDRRIPSNGRELYNCMEVSK